MTLKEKLVGLSLALCALSVSLFTLQAAEKSPAGTGIISERLLDNVSQSWDGAALPHYPEGKPAITMLRITVPPHTKLARHYHSVINVGYMLSGELTVTSDTGQSQCIKAGEPLVEMVGSIHYGENKADIPAVILVFYAGDSQSPITTQAP